MKASLVAVTLFTVSLTATVHAQNYSHIGRLACSLHDQGEDLEDAIDDHMRRSPFQRRLLNDAADFIRVADRIETTADRGGNIRQIQNDVASLQRVIECMDRTISQAEAAPHDDFHCNPHLIHRMVHQVEASVSQLRAQVEAACVHGQPRGGEWHSNDRYQQPSYQSPSFPQQYQTQPYPYQNQQRNYYAPPAGYSFPSGQGGQTNYQYSTPPLVLGSPNGGPGVTFGNGGFSIRLGR